MDENKEKEAGNGPFKKSFQHKLKLTMFQNYLKIFRYLVGRIVYFCTYMLVSTRTIHLELL